MNVCPFPGLHNWEKNTSHIHIKRARKLFAKWKEFESIPRFPTSDIRTILHVHGIVISHILCMLRLCSRVQEWIHVRQSAHVSLSMCVLYQCANSPVHRKQMQIILRNTKTKTHRRLRMYRWHHCHRHRRLISRIRFLFNTLQQCPASGQTEHTVLRLSASSRQWAVVDQVS